MPRNGSGGYSRYTPGTPYVANTTIDEDVVNAEMDDLGNEVANSIAKDGQTVPTANLPMGGYKHTGVANGSARNHYAAVGQAQDGALTYGSVGGTGDAITLTLSPSPSAYAAGQKFTFVASAANTGAATINVNSLGAKAIKRNVSTALNAGDIPNGGVVILEYDGTNFQLLNPATIGAITSSPITMATAKLIGRTTAGTGAPEEIAIGSGLSMAAGTLGLADAQIIGRAYAEYDTYASVTAVIPFDDTIPTSSQGDQIMTLPYACASTTNRLRISVYINGQTPGTGNTATATLIADGTCVRACAFGGDGVLNSAAFAHELVPGSTSSKTYAVRVGVAAGTLYLNGYSSGRIYGGAQKCSMIIEEIKA